MFYEKKYLKYKQKYLELKNKNKGGTHINWEYEEIKGDWNKPINDEWDGEMKNVKYSDQLNNEKYYEKIDGKWKGKYKDENYDIYNESKDNDKKINKYGIWDNQKYYGVDNNNKTKITIDNDNATIFKWHKLYDFIQDGHINEKLKNNFDNSWLISYGFNDSFGCIYSFLLYISLTIDTTIVFPKDNKLEKQEFLTDVIKPLFFKIIDYYEINYFKNNSLKKKFQDVDITLKKLDNSKETFKLCGENIKENYLALQICRDKIDNIEYDEYSLINSDILNNFSVIFNINILFFYQDNYLLFTPEKNIIKNKIDKESKKELLKRDTVVIIHDNSKYFVLFNNDDIVKYETLKKIFKI